MIFVADYLALGLVITLSMFFFDSKTDLRYMSSSGRIYLGCLITTALTAIIDMASVVMHDMTHLPLWLQVGVNSLYFVSSIVTTTVIALYLFTKILEHTHDHRCAENAYVGLTVLLVLHLAMVIANWWTGWLFYFEDGRYCRGPLNALGYAITVAQMALVIICYFRNRKNANRPMRRVLLQTAPLIPICIIVNRLQPGIMLNPFIMAMVDTVLFLTFMGQRQGIHSLTELNDLHRFFDVADRRISRKESFTVFRINLRDFSTLNQKYGYQYGDEYLYHFASGLDKLFPGGLAFHMNGAVFAVLLRTADPGDGEKQANRLLSYLNEGIPYGGDTISLDYVVVQYVSDGTEKSAAELFEIMEHVVNKAYGLKQRYIRCTAADVEEMVRKRYLQERLRKIDREHGYEVWFQPVCCLAAERFCSMEALIRLREPDGSMISPAEFIPLAEQTGQVSAITWFVLEEACRMLNTHPELADVTVSINLPMAQMLEKDFVRHFTSIVDGAGINHHSICIEFTERAILDNFEQTKSIMEELGRSGFRFYLDDFGAGYSNFNCLTQLPFQIIKLDRSLVKYGKDGCPDYTMVCTLTKLLHDMELVVIAEGAETPEAVQALSDQGIDRIQGFALAMPMAEGKLVDFYRERAAGAAAQE
jgi:EAL domain-containing protein (putative c-di-GMP-specific phosphodiesterase class I)/GGDEF domain-containing protein